jgi:small-conductance mechanosensitive channel
MTATSDNNTLRALLDWSRDVVLRLAGIDRDLVSLDRQLREANQRIDDLAARLHRLETARTAVATQAAKPPNRTVTPSRGTGAKTSRPKLPPAARSATTMDGETAKQATAEIIHAVGVAQRRQRTGP